MPTYDYVCDACSHEFEAFEPITAPPQVECPECRQDALRRKIGPGAAILFKGSGFYQTDYRSESYKKRAEAEKPKETSAAKSDSAATATTTQAESKASSSSTPSDGKPG
jgi:putative FmdB family regulatory protein